VAPNLRPASATTASRTAAVSAAVSEQVGGPQPQRERQRLPPGADLLARVHVEQPDGLEHVTRRARDGARADGLEHVARGHGGVDDERDVLLRHGEGRHRRRLSGVLAGHPEEPVEVQLERDGPSGQVVRRHHGRVQLAGVPEGLARRPDDPRAPPGVERRVRVRDERDGRTHDLRHRPHQRERIGVVDGTSGAPPA
jgi:hypothetical protein